MNRTVWGTRLILRPSSEYCSFLIYSHRKVDDVDIAPLSYRPVCAFTKPIIRRFLSWLSNNVGIYKGTCFY